MALLRVDFQEGFDHDGVVVRLDGGAEARREQVTTSEMVGYAGSVELERPPGPFELAVEVTTRGLKAATAVDVDGDVYAGVTVSGGDLRLVVSPEPMGYL